MNPTEITEIFTRHQKVMVTFYKKDGSVRSMICTRQLGLIPAQFHPKTDRKPPEESLPVFDMEKQGWRSFRFDSIINVEGM